MRSARTPFRFAVWLTALTAFGVGYPCLTAWASSARPSFADCITQLARAPSDRAASYCVYDVGLKTQRWDEARQVLMKASRQTPGRPWITYHLALVEWHRQSDIEALLRSAADGFVRERQVDGEIAARRSLLALFSQGRDDAEAAAIEGRHLRRLMQTVKDPVLRAEAATNYASYQAHFAEDFQGAYRTLKDVEKTATAPERRYRARFAFLTAMADVATQLGRYREAVFHLGNLEDAARAYGHQAGVVHAGVERGEVWLRQLEHHADEELQSRAMAMALRISRLAEKIQDVHQVPRLHLQQARLMFGDRSRRDEVRDHLERCMKTTAETKNEVNRVECLAWLALWWSTDDPIVAVRRMTEAMVLASQLKNPLLLATTWRMQADLSWRINTPTEAYSHSLQALERIEVIRALQPPGAGRAGAFTRWASDYQHLAGRLLQRRAQAFSSDPIGDAFNLMERMRARDLLDIARMAQVRTSTAQLDTREQAWRQKLQTLAQRQRDLLETPVPARSDLRAEISRLEREAARLRDEVWAESLAGRIGLPDYARLEGVQAALAADEAMLLYQIGETQKFWGERGGGAWAVVVTSTSVSVHEVPDRRALLAPMTIFDGLFDGHDELIEKPAKLLYQALVAQPIAAVPSQIKKLIIVPDGDLHRLPFAALMTAHGRPLGLDFAISFSPSATVWLDKRRAGLSQAQSLPAIVMADPRRQNRQTQVADRGVLDMVAEPGALPFAQKEGRTIMQMLGEGSQLRSGVDASEASFKADLNAPYRVVHFAAHAIVDDVAPERSALWLSTGSRNEDGLLQAREVMGLDLSNRIVVLASCRSASGRIDSAEGIMSLSRAFLAAGATAVVGSRWRLNDRHGLFLSKALYTHLSRGASVVESLRQARISAYNAGLPSRAWASLNVQGDGSAIPFPDGSPAYRRAWSMRMAGLMGLLLVGALGIRFWWRHRRRYAEP